MKDSQIVALYWQRSERAITETNQKYGPYCFAVAENILEDQQDSEECVNDTWLRAWNAIPPQKPEKLRSFLAKITRNLALNKLKARKAAKRGSGEMNLVLDELTECLADSKNTETEFAAKELADCINRFAHTLSERDCNIFLRRYFYVESVAEIAKKYCVKESNVLMILSRTRKKLKNYLQQEGYL